MASAAAAKSFGSKMLVLSEKDVRKVLTMADCLKINKEAYMSITSASSRVGGKGHVPTRLSLPGPPKAGVAVEGAADCTLFKPAAFYADQSTPNKESLMGMKIISLRADNPKGGFPLAPATVAVLDADTGIVQAIVSSTYLTGARTAAGSGLATQLARPDLEHLVVFGAGLQAETHIDAIHTAIDREIPKITIINRTLERANQLKERLTCCISCEVVLLDDKAAVEKAVYSADVIAATTNTATPIFDCKLKPGCHINGIGSYTPDMQEIPESVVNRSVLLIDTPEAKSVGDLKHLGADKGDSDHPITLLGEALEGANWKEKASSSFDCTFYKGVGTSIQDIMTADLVVKRARELGIGTQVDMA